MGGEALLHHPGECGHGEQRQRDERGDNDERTEGAGYQNYAVPPALVK